MGRHEKLAKQIRELNDAGIEVGHAMVIGDGVFFRRREAAFSFARNHEREVVRVEGQVSGWLVKNPPRR
jgi:uridylate kinase